MNFDHIANLGRLAAMEKMAVPKSLFRKTPKIPTAVPTPSKVPTAPEMPGREAYLPRRLGETPEIYDARKAAGGKMDMKTDFPHLIDSTHPLYGKGVKGYRDAPLSQPAAMPVKPAQPAAVPPTKPVATTPAAKLTTTPAAKPTTATKLTPERIKQLKSRDQKFAAKFWANQPPGMEDTMLKIIHRSKSKGVLSLTGNLKDQNRLSAYRILAQQNGYKVGPFRMNPESGTAQAKLVWVGKPRAVK